MQLDIEKSLELYKRFLETIKPRIDSGIEKHITVPATLLAKEVCGQFDMEWSTAYNLIKMCVAANDHLEIKLGPKGGVALKEEYWKKNTDVEIKEISEISSIEQ
jgi:hypothetical protein